MRVACVCLLLLPLNGFAAGDVREPTRVVVNGVELHYVEQGHGEALIFLHGGSGDYRSWESRLATFSPRYRVIAYSRRYSYPNQNPKTIENVSALTEADDLAA